MCPVVVSIKHKQQIQREGEGSGQTHLFPPSFLDAGFTLCLCCFWMLTVFGSKKIMYVICLPCIMVLGEGYDK